MPDKTDIAVIDATLIRAGQQLVALQKRTGQPTNNVRLDRARQYLAWVREEIALLGAVTSPAAPGRQPLQAQP